MTSGQIPEVKPFSDQDETWFTPPIVVPLFLLLAVVLRVFPPAALGSTEASASPLVASNQKFRINTLR